MVRPVVPHPITAINALILICCVLGFPVCNNSFASATDKSPDTPPDTSHDKNSEFARTILEAHTQEREKMGATNMMHLTWDLDLADLASKHAGLCIFEHGNFVMDDGTVLGQNMARGIWAPATTSNVDYPAEEHVTNWIREKKYFNFDSAKCPDMGLCGHYSQMVWAPTSKIGCAHQFCPNMMPPSDYIVCNYWPFGNENGELAYSRSGKPCGGCNLKGGTACVSGQCVDCKQHPQLAVNSTCTAYDVNSCKDKSAYCGQAIEDFCPDSMWRTFSVRYCERFCKLC